MKKLLIAGGIVVLLVIVAGAVAPFFIPADLYKDQLVARVRDATGRDLRIAGPLSLSLFPDVRLEARDVSLANPPGTSAPSLAAVKKLEVAVRLMPLLSGRVEIERLILDDPTIDLEIDAQGRPSWDVAGAGDEGQPVGLEALSRLGVRDVSIRNGTIVLVDRRRDAREELTKGTVTLSAPGLDAPFTMSGSALYRGEKLDFSAKLDSEGALLRAGGKTGLTVSLTAKRLSLTFAGSVANDGTAAAPMLAFDGKAALASPSLRDLIAWSGRDIVLPKHGFGALALSGTVHAQSRVAKFTDAKLSLDAIAAIGTMILDGSHPRPAIAAALQTGMLDLNPYLPPPVVGWSHDTIDIAMFRGVDAEVAVAAQGVRLRHVQIGASDVTAHLKDAKLTLDVTRMALYRGSGKAKVAVDATGETAAVTIDGALSGVDVGGLARDAADVSGIAGTGNFTLAGTARGNSEAALIASLTGKASFRLANGSIGGVDLGGMLKNSQSAFASGGGRTAISRASGSFTITRGTMRNSDLSVTAEGMDATGTGSIDLPGRTLSYRVTPHLIAGIITVPVTVSGPWDHLSFQPDFADIVGGVVTAPVNVIGGAAGGAGRAGKSIGGTLKSLFGN